MISPVTEGFLSLDSKKFFFNSLTRSVVNVETGEAVIPDFSSYPNLSSAFIEYLASLGEDLDTQKIERMRGIFAEFRDRKRVVYGDLLDSPIDISLIEKSENAVQVVTKEEVEADIARKIERINQMYPMERTFGVSVEKGGAFLAGKLRENVDDLDMGAIRMAYYDSEMGERLDEPFVKEELSDDDRAKLKEKVKVAVNSDSPLFIMLIDGIIETGNTALYTDLEMRKIVAEIVMEEYSDLEKMPEVVVTVEALVHKGFTQEEISEGKSLPENYYAERLLPDRFFYKGSGTDDEGGDDDRAEEGFWGRRSPLIEAVQ